MPALAAVAPDLKGVQAHDADVVQGVLDVVELVFPDDGFDFFQHGISPMTSGLCASVVQSIVTPRPEGSRLRVRPFPVAADVQAHFLFHAGDPEPDAHIQQLGHHIGDPEGEDDGDRHGQKLDGQLGGVAVEQAVGARRC